MSEPVLQKPDTESIAARIESIWVYPIKSCAGIELTESEITIDGLLWDRNWMVVDREGEAITQREAPAMALIQPAFRMGGLMLRAPGMLPLHLSMDNAEEATRVQLWGESLPAYEMGAVAAQWFTDFLGGSKGPLGPLRLVRFDPEFDRECDSAWTGREASTTQFADGFGLLVTSTASLAAINKRLTNAGATAIDDRRFRPNIVLAGLDSHGEDMIAEWSILADDDEIRVEHVKPCGRCSIPDVDPAQGVALAGAVSDTLLATRRDPRIDGAPSYGMNAVLRAGAGAIVRVGQTVRARLRFD